MDRCQVCLVSLSMSLYVHFVSPILAYCYYFVSCRGLSRRTHNREIRRNVPPTCDLLSSLNPHYDKCVGCCFVCKSRPSSNLCSSDIRQIPSHQEVRLSPTTLTSVIIEINQLVHETQISASIKSQLPANTEANAAAALHHLRDILDETDQVTIVSPPREVSLSHLSASGKGEGFALHAKVLNASPAEAVDATTSIHLLLVRLKAQSTDIVVMVNVPYAESRNEEIRVSEDEFAKAMMEVVKSTLEVKSWDLFAED